MARSADVSADRFLGGVDGYASLDVCNVADVCCVGCGGVRNVFVVEAAVSSNGISIDTLKKKVKHFHNLLSFFVGYFGPTDSAAFLQAQRNFVESMAAYSVVQYYFRIKDR